MSYISRTRSGLSISAEMMTRIVEIASLRIASKIPFSCEHTESVRLTCWSWLSQGQKTHQQIVKMIYSLADSSFEHVGWIAMLLLRRVRCNVFVAVLDELAVIDWTRRISEVLCDKIIGRKKFPHVSDCADGADDCDLDSSCTLLLVHHLFDSYGGPDACRLY